jgi:hypothetical protein
MEGVVTAVNQLAFTDAYSIAIIHPLDFTVSIIAYFIFPIEFTRVMELVTYEH